MKTRLFIAAALLSIGTARAFAGDIGVSVNLGEPGFFGQIDIGNAPPPQVVYPQAVIVEPAPEYAQAPPIYLHVPAGYERHWREHCHEYHACNRRVLFVRDDWYQNT